MVPPIVVFFLLIVALTAIYAIIDITVQLCHNRHKRKLIKHIYGEFEQLNTLLNKGKKEDKHEE